MTKVLFAYNGRIEVDNAGSFYGNELNDTLISRYRSFGTTVSFLVRTRKISDEDKKSLTPFSSKDFSVIPVPDFTSPKAFIKNVGKVKATVKKAVDEHDVVVARLPSLVGRLAVKRAIELGKPYLIEVVGCPWDALSNHSALGKLYAPIAYKALKEQVYPAPYVLYVTDKFLQERYPTTGKSVGVTDVVLKDISPDTLEKRKQKIEALRSNPAPMKLGTAAGYDVKFKGQEFVIKALAVLKAKGILFKYIPVGKGTGNAMRKLAAELGVEDLIEFRGQIRHEDVFPYLDELDIYVQPSKQEGLPRSIVEAMSRACPVLGSRTGGIPELINDDYIFEKGDVNKLAEILENLTPDKLLAMAEENYKHSFNFTRDITDRKRDEFYREFKSSYSQE